MLTFYYDLRLKVFASYTHTVSLFIIPIVFIAQDHYTSHQPKTLIVVKLADCQDFIHSQFPPKLIADIFFSMRFCDSTIGILHNNICIIRGILMGYSEAFLFILRINFIVDIICRSSENMIR